MSPRTQRILKWALRLLLVLIVVCALYVGILAFPSPLFAHESRYGSFRVHSAEPLPADMDRVIAEAGRRLAATEQPREGARYDVFLCTTRVRRFAADYHPIMRHSRFEGNPAEIIAHEIAHFASIDSEVARALWRWQILVEFLGEVKGCLLGDLAREE